MKGWRLAVTLCVMGFGMIVQATVAQASVEDLLYEKGQITKEEWLKLKAEHKLTVALEGISSKILLMICFCLIPLPCGHDLGDDRSIVELLVR